MHSTPSIDTHVHIRSGTTDAALIHAQMMEAGVSCIRSAGSRDGTDLSLGSMSIIPTGRALCAHHDAHGKLFGTGVTMQAEIEDAIQRNISGGAQTVKAFACGIVNLSRGNCDLQEGLSQEQLQWVMRAANAHDVPVMIHANGDAIATVIDAARKAPSSVPVSIEHGFFMEEDWLRRMHDTGIAWTPTVAALERGARNDTQRRNANAIIVQHLQMIAAASRIGVQVTMGTDAVLPNAHYATCVQKERQYLCDAGVSEEALYSGALAVMGRFKDMYIDE